MTIKCQQQDIHKIRDGIPGHGRQEIVEVVRPGEYEPAYVHLRCGCSIPLAWLPRVEQTLVRIWEGGVA